MSEFTAAANLDIVVTPDSLRSARRTIERELGDVEVGVGSNRPTGGGGAVGARGPEPAGVDLSRRQLGQQETLVELAGERNELLEEILDEGVPGGGGGGGAGGFGLGFASRGILGGIAAGAGGAAGLTGLLSAARLGGGAFSPGIFGRGGTGDPSELGPGGPDDPISQGLADLITRVTGIEQVDQAQQPGAQGRFEEIMGFFGGLNIPEGGTIDRRQEVTQTNEFGIDNTVNIELSGVNERRIEQIVKRRIDRFAQEIRDELRREFGGGPSPRTALLRRERAGDPNPFTPRNENNF